jgi:hypothetical protein
MLNEIGPRTENCCKSKIEWKDPNERIWIGDRYYTEEQYKERRAYRRNLVDSEPRLFVRNKFSKQKSKAKLVRNLEWALDIDKVTEAIVEQGRCAISGRPFVYKTGSIDAPSIDRIDSERGYTPDNIMFVGAHINIMKGRLDLETFVNLCKDVAKFRSNGFG